MVAVSELDDLVEKEGRTKAQIRKMQEERRGDAARAKFFPTFVMRRPPSAKQMDEIAVPL